MNKKNAPSLVLVALGIIVLVLVLTQSSNDLLRASGGESLIAASILLGAGVVSLKK
jgi:preprotein translocase subunit SecG